MNIAVITPIKHLLGVQKLIESKGHIFYLEKGNKQEVRDLLLKNNINVILCNPNQQSYKIDKELLENTSIKTINSCSTGLNHIDLDYCKKNNIKIQCHKNDFNLINQLPSTSELAFGLMLSLLRQIPQGQKHVSEYKWDYTQFMGRQVKDLKVGIVGYGRLGKMMYNFCKAFGASVMIYDPYVRDQLPDRFLLNNWCSSLEQLFEFSDVVSLHVHVTDETKYMINKDLFGSIKKDCYIINTSRGEIVNELDIAVGLKTNIITGYATDVIENEFDDLTKSPIIDAMNTGENIIITPHVGGMTIEGQTKAYKHSIKKL
jgi:D-3-phosphoglycerate dehydrogenase / 2-oxoglutarate reductase